MSILNLPDDHNILQIATDQYGGNLQLVIAIEEMAELQKEIAKSMRGNGSRSQIVEELADVLILMKTLTIIFDVSDDEINQFVRFKLARLYARHLRDLPKEGGR